MESNKKHFVIGTAGHIDHGKTSMVIHLTGKNTDWLKEEKERGMTISLWLIHEQNKDKTFKTRSFKK